MKVDVRIVILMLGAAAFWKVPGLQGHTVFLLLIHVVLVLLKFFAVIGVAAAVLIGIVAWCESYQEKWEEVRESREPKKNSQIGGGLGYAR
jgi:hypothetical protein